MIDNIIALMPKSNATKQTLELGNVVRELPIGSGLHCQIAEAACHPTYEKQRTRQIPERT